MNTFKVGVSVCAAVVLCVLNASALADTFGTGGNQFTMDFVPISGATNPTSGYGIVNNDYRMGTYEITNDQWTKFQASLGVPVTGSPSVAYDETSYWSGANVPTNKVTWYEAAQFVNWLNTSTEHQAAYKFTGTQGQSDYTLATWSTAEADNGTNLFRHKDAMYYLPSEHEWVKGAYWNGAAIQTYATKNDAAPTAGVHSNYNSPLGQPWSVGSGSQELNGTYNMMGNVWEWMESPYSSTYGTTVDRGRRGGSFGTTVIFTNPLKSSYRTNYGPSDEANYIGFRVASEVPEPASLGLLSLGGLMLLKRKRRA